MKKRLLSYWVLGLVLIATTGSAQYRYHKLVWSDEFNATSYMLPDTSKWNYDAGNGCPQLCGWGNNELQHYMVGRKENTRVQDGQLVMEVHKESYSTAQYTSARMVTRNRAHWTYGRVTVRAKIPTGRGVWPAIWMLPVNNEYGNWPHSGEIDIMEHVGYWPDSLFGTIHTGAYNGMKNTQKTQSIFVDNLTETFHEYSIEWSPDEIMYYLDGKKYHEFRKKPGCSSEFWPFDKEFYLIMNVAVGGNWGGKFGVDEQIFPQRLVVDYVRVYQ